MLHLSAVRDPSGSEREARAECKQRRTRPPKGPPSAEGRVTRRLRSILGAPPTLFALGPGFYDPEGPPDRAQMKHRGLFEIRLLGSDRTRGRCFCGSFGRDAAGAAVRAAVGAAEAAGAMA